MANDNGYVLKVSEHEVKLQNQILLNHVSFNVKKRTTLAILGSNGLGKTVMLRTLNHIPRTGSIEWTEKVKIGYFPQYVTVSDRYRNEDLSTKIHRYIMFSAVFGLAAVVSGVLLAGYFGQPPGPVVVFTGITIFAVTVLVNWRKKYTT